MLLEKFTPLINLSKIKTPRRTFDILTSGKEVINMKWNVNNIITLILAITTVLQTISAWRKNVNDAKNNATIEKNRHEEKRLEYDLKEKQLDSRNINSEREARNQLNKLRIQNSQKNYEKFLFHAEQGVFEHYVTVTNNAIAANQFPLVFPQDYIQMQSLVLLYCPNVADEISLLNDINRPYDPSTTTFNKQKYEETQKQEFINTFNIVVKKLSHELMHK